MTLLDRFKYNGLLYLLPEFFSKLVPLNHTDTVLMEKYELSSLNQDYELYSLFLRLYPYPIRPRLFEKTIDLVDLLIYRIIQLKTHGPISACSDRAGCFQLYHQILSHLEAIVTTTKSHPDPRLVVEVHSIYKKMYSNLQDKWIMVMRLTQKAELTSW